MYRTGYVRVLSRFFDRVGHEMHLISIFLLNNVTIRLTKIMNNLLEDLKILIFKVILCGKLIESFQKNSLKNIGLGDQLLKYIIF